MFPQQGSHPPWSSLAITTQFNESQRLRFASRMPCLSPSWLHVPAGNVSLDHLLQGAQHSQSKDKVLGGALHDVRKMLICKTPTSRLRLRTVPAQQLEASHCSARAHTRESRAALALFPRHDHSLQMHTVLCAHLARSYVRYYFRGYGTPAKSKAGKDARR